MLPILLESSFFTLYSYPLFMGLSWGIAFYLTRNLFEKENLESSGLVPLFAGVFLSAWLGAKLFFLLFSSEDKLSEYLYADAFWLGGGFVFYGGLILGLIFYFLYSLRFKRFDFSLSKFLIPGLVIGHGVGRLGCFLTGCCYGSHCELPWAVHMHGEFRHPVQLYEAISLFSIGFLSLRWLKGKRENFYIITRYILLYSSVRFSLEFFRGDKIRGMHVLDLSTSQMISAALFAGTVAMILYNRTSRRSFS